VAERVIREHGAVYFVTDLHAAALMPAETRRYFAQWATRFAAKAVIYYGASLPLRAVATLLLSAARLRGNHQRAFELFVQTEQEARAALAEFKRSQVPRSSDTKELDSKRQRQRAGPGWCSTAALGAALTLRRPAKSLA
jgi:hypothetical protein